MIPIKTIEELIDKHALLEKELSSGSVDKKTFAEIEDEVDIYVFDYIGTAFNQACATNKPVIYFDIGLRNISRHAMTKIKERTVYFNLKIDEIPSLTEIEERIFEMKKVNNLTKNYSLTNTQKIRSQSLLEGLEI